MVMGKIIWTAPAGTIPFLSFVVEHQRTKEVKAQFGIRGRVSGLRHAVGHRTFRPSPFVASGLRDQR